MNHQKIYNNIVEIAKIQNRQKLNKRNLNYVYYEKHHITPKCMNGTNDEDNLVLLTAREHYVCHKLLTYIYKGNRKIALAFYRMSLDKRNRKISSRDYSYTKQLISEISHTEETKKRISNALIGKKHSEENRKKQSKNYKEKEINKGEKNPMFGIAPWNKGKTGVYSEKTLEKMKKPKTEEHKLKLRKPKTEEHKLKLRKPNNKSWVCNEKISILIDKNKLDDFLKFNSDFKKGRIISDEQRHKQSNRMKGRIPWNKKLNTNIDISR